MGKDDQIIVSNDPIPQYLYQYFCMTGIPFSGNVEGIGYTISEVVVTPLNNGRLNSDTYSMVHRKSSIMPVHKNDKEFSQGIGSSPDCSNKVEPPSIDFWMGLTSSVGENAVYDIGADRWLGKDGRFHSFYEMPTRLQNIGNPDKALKWSRRLSRVGHALTVYSLFDLANKWFKEDIGLTTVGLELGSIVAGYKLKGPFSIAWGVGWELGRTVTQTEWYQRERFVMAYKLWERKFGPPKDSNIDLWVYFFETYEDSLK